MILSLALVIYLPNPFVATGSPHRQCPQDVGFGCFHVRHTPSGQWHPATDDLLGTDAYGESNFNSAPWSIPFSRMSFSEFLFADGYCSWWLIASKHALNGGGAYNGGAKRQMTKSSSNSAPYTAYGHFRLHSVHCVLALQGTKKSLQADPWISLEDSTSEIVHGEDGKGRNRWFIQNTQHRGD